MDKERFHAILDQARGYSLNTDQRRAVDHDTGPLWLLAGPGSGKTEALVTRCLKLICVDQVLPRSIFLTTFTQKASRSLEDKLTEGFLNLQSAEPSLRSLDISEIRIGTLHALCNEILQEYRYQPYRNVRLIDDVEQALFICQHANITTHDDLNFWRFFHHVVPQPWSKRYRPGKWKCASAGLTLFNHIAESIVSLELMKDEDSHWAVLAELYEQYEIALTERYRCDFAHLQKHFLRFLRSPLGEKFLAGSTSQAGLEHVLVDEYQDTNSIQERIYLEMASKAPHNLTVVGDDDQALYRFRGATVACMVHFDKACQRMLGSTPRKIQLVKNYRSHPTIVDFFQRYIESHPEIQIPGVRAPEKQPVEPASDISGAYPAVSWITTKRARDLGIEMAQFIQDHLIGDGIVEDLSQCVLLLRSPKDSPNNAGPFLRALETAGIPTYNPRSKTFLESVEVQTLLATLIQLLDPDNIYNNIRIHGFQETVRSWLETFETLDEDGWDSTQLESYLEKSVDSIQEFCRGNPGEPLGVSILEIIYRVLSREPFRSWRSQPERNLRLSKVTRLFEGYHSMELDYLYAATDGDYLDPGVQTRFLYMMVGYLIDAEISDDEDEEVIVPEGMFPVMSIHQAKGLEFPVVFVGQLGQSGRVGATQFLDQVLAPFRDDLYPRPSREPQELLDEDNIRQWYVAYSRAKNALVLLASPSQLKNKISIPGRDVSSFRQSIPIVIAT